MRVFTARVSALRRPIAAPCRCAPSSGALCTRASHFSTRAQGGDHYSVLGVSRQVLCTRASRFSTHAQGGDHYSVLGVSRQATSQEIKKAYFHEAKKWHPDINPGHESKFRRLAEAYDVLRDPTRRSAYDAAQRAGPSGAQQRQQGQRHHHQQQYQQQQHQQQQSQWSGRPDNIFRQVWSELGFAEIDAYIQQIRQEMYNAGHAATTRRDFGPAWNFAREHKALVIGTAIPIALFFRSPIFASWALRLLGPAFALSLRVSPQMTWYLFSRLWIAAIKYVEKSVTASGAAGNGGGKRP